jgi:hypothetical protein
MSLSGRESPRTTEPKTASSRTFQRWQNAATSGFSSCRRVATDIDRNLDSNDTAIKTQKPRPLLEVLEQHKVAVLADRLREQDPQKTGRSLKQTAAERLPALSPAVAARLDVLFDPLEALKTEALVGGTAPDAVRAALDAALERVEGR